MSNNVSRKRRKLLIGISSGIVGASQLPETWNKPIISSVLLPAHAQTTGDSDSDGEENEPTSYSDDLIFNPMQAGALSNPLDSVLSVLVQDAHACCSAETGSMCIDTSAAPDFFAQVLITDGKTSALFTGSGSIGSPATTLAHVGGCDYFGDVTVAVPTKDTSGADYVVTSNSGYEISSGTAPVGSNCPSNPGSCNDE